MRGDNMGHGNINDMRGDNMGHGKTTNGLTTWDMGI